MPTPGRTRGWRMGRIGGAPIILTPGWAILTVVLVAYSAPLLQSRLGFTPALAYAGAAAIPLLFFVSVLAHELAHGAVARRLGVRVSEYVVSLWGGHTAFGSAIDRPGASAAIAAAGPATNAVLAGMFHLLARTSDGVTSVAFSAATFSNVIVAIFNILPALPMDGGKLLEALVWKVRGDRLTGTIVAGRFGQVLAVAVPVVVFGRSILAGTRPDLWTGVWAILVASLLWQGATASVRQAKARQRAMAIDLGALAVPTAVLPLGGTVTDLDRARMGSPAAVVVLIDTQGQPVAIVDDAAVASIGASERAAVPLSAVARGLPRAAISAAHAGPAAVAQVARAAQAGSAVVVLVDRSRVNSVLAVVPVAAVAQRLAAARK